MIQFSIRNPYAVAVAALVTVVLGVTAFQRLPADLLPIFKTPAVQIVTFYPGMPPEVMERDIMSRLERWTGQSVGISHQEGKSMLGVSVVKDFFREGITFDTAMSQVTSYAVSDMYYLPPGTVPPMVMPFDPTASVPLCLVSVSSPTMNEKELYDVAYFELRNRLQSIQGVIAPAVYGGKLRRILAYVNREKLEARGLSPMDVVKALQKQNVFIPAGNIKAGDLDYQIFANAMPDQVALLNDIPLAVHDGATIYMRDVAEVKDSAQIQTNVVRINGKRQVYIPVYRQPGANTIQIVNAIKDNLLRIEQRLREMNPKAKDLALGVVLDQSVYVRGALDSLLMEGLLGAGFAALTVLVFLRRLRPTLVVLIGLPIGLLAALAGLYFASASLNIMTMGGLALVIGILIDQSIVVVESIVRRVEEGETPFSAALHGAQEVAVPLFVSTVTFCVVFFPVTFLTGMASYLFTPMALAATFAMAAANLFAITLVPAFCARFLRPKSSPHTNEEDKDEAWSLGKGCERFIGQAVKVRWLVIVGACIAFAFTLPLLARSGSELFPAVDAGQFQLLVRLPSGTRIERTEAVIAKIEREIAEEIGEADPEFPAVESHPDSNLRMLISNVGVLMDWPAAYTPNAGPMDAFMLVQLKNKKGKPGTFEYASRLRERFDKEFPDARIAFDTGGILTAALNMGEPAPIHLQVAGSDLHVGNELAQQVKQVLSQVPGATDVRVAQAMDYPALNVDIDRVKAMYAGVNVDDVMKNLVTATNSSVGFSPAFWIDNKNGNHYFIGAQYAEEELKSIDTLRDIPITGAGSTTTVPLRTLSTMTETTGPAIVNHKNITRVFDIYANVVPGIDVGTVVSRIEAHLHESKELGLMPQVSDRGPYFDIASDKYKGRGYTLTLTGEVASMREMLGQFQQGFFLALVLMYLVMVVQFRSFLDPLIVLLTVPLGLIGVALMLSLTGTHLNIPAVMGIIMMVGLVVGQNTLLVDTANRHVAAGMSVRTAIATAGRVRIRPILMTKVTAVCAMIPMAIGGHGAEANAPLARAIIGGTLSVAVLTLIVVPCLYVVFKREPKRPAVAADHE